jgi:hypothetical protein
LENAYKNQPKAIQEIKYQAQLGIGGFVSGVPSVFQNNVMVNEKVVIVNQEEKEFFNSLIDDIK